MIIEWKGEGERGSNWDYQKLISRIGSWAAKVGLRMAHSVSWTYLPISSGLSRQLSLQHWPSSPRRVQHGKLPPTRSSSSSPSPVLAGTVRSIIQDIPPHICQLSAIQNLGDPFLSITGQHCLRSALSMVTCLNFPVVSLGQFNIIMPGHEMYLQPFTTHRYQMKGINRHKDALYVVGEY